MHHLVARHIRAVAVVIDEFDNFPHAAEYIRSKSVSEEGELENDLTTAAAGVDEMRPRDHKIRDLKYRSQYPPVCVFLVYNPVILNSNDNLK